MLSVCALQEHFKAVQTLKPKRYLKSIAGAPPNYNENPRDGVNHSLQSGTGQSAELTNKSLKLIVKLKTKTLSSCHHD